MIGKNNHYLKNTKEGTKVESYSIKKFKVGTASVVIGASIFFGAGAVAQASEEVSNNTISDNTTNSNISEDVAGAPVAIEQPVAKDTTKEDVASAVASKLNATEKETLDKTSLTKLIEEIDGKFSNGKYDSKTEESVNRLKAVLEEVRTVLNNATTQAELTKAQARLATATTQLKTKPTEKKVAPEVDTTNGKQTVGKKAENTEKATESNSIANSGTRDERTGKALNKENAFRTDGTTTDNDPSANQTYREPDEDADLKTLAKKLLGLNATVENNAKLANEMNTLGASKKVEKGTVKEIDEFGGWKAVDGGVFAIARRTEEGVYPLETINSTLDDTVWLQEQAFDRDTEYTLLLSKSRTRHNRTEEVFDGSKYKPRGEGSGITKNVARYKGIEKIFTAYSTAEGSDVVIKFKPGYVGDSDGSKAKYKVQVYSISGNQETPVYETTFDPSRSVSDNKKIVTKATDGTNAPKIKISRASNSTTIDAGVDNTTRPGFIGKREAEKLMAEAKNLPNGKAGTFTSKPITLPKGADHYKVRISLAEQDRTGMSYQAWDDKYSVPVTGADFSIAQDTTRVAKSLLQKVYDKLIETVDKDKRGKTPETQATYQNQLDAIKEALTPGKYTSTKDYQDLLKFALEKQKALKVDKSALTRSKASLDNLVNEDPTPGKTPETVKAYNQAKTVAEQEAEKAKAVIESDTSTVDEVAQAVANVKAARAELTTARTLLVVAASDAQKTKLQNDLDALKPADTNGKTEESITEYGNRYNELKSKLEKAKEVAKNVLGKTVNAGKDEATYAQIEVDKIKAELDKAATLLKDKGDTTALEQAKNDLNDFINQQTTARVTDGKTKDSQNTYTTAKSQAEQAVTDAQDVIDNENSTTEDVARALENVKAKKAALEAAKNSLVEAATPEQIKALEEDVAKLVRANTDEKTPESIAKYNNQFTNLEEELNKAKDAVRAVKEAGQNATKLAALEAQTKVDKVYKKLEEERAKLVDKATEDQKIELRKVEEELKTVDTTGKTKESIAEYNSEVAKLNSQIENAKNAVKTLLDKGDNAGKLEAYALQTEINKLKGKLDDAATRLRNIDKSADKKEIETAAKNATDVIDSDPNLTEDKKVIAKARIAEEARKAIDEIENATIEENVIIAKNSGILAIAREAAKAEIEAALKAQEKAIEAKAESTTEEKDKAKEAAKAKAEEAKANIDKAADKATVTSAKEAGEEAISQIQPEAEVKKAAKQVIAEKLEAKLAEIETAANSTTEEKEEAKEAAKAKAQAATAAIDKAKDNESVEKALRLFLYQIDQEGLVFDLPSLDIEDSLKLLINGTVVVEQGKKISDEDILAKINLPKGVEVINIEKPTTLALGKTQARVELKLSDGTIITIEVPIEVIKGESASSEMKRSPEQTSANEQVSTNITSKKLPNTGATETNTGLAGLGLGIFGGLLAAAKRRRERKED